MSDTVRRVFHPTLQTFLDVPSGDVEAWKKEGWRVTRPDHISEEDAQALPVGFLTEIPTPVESVTVAPAKKA